MEKKTAKKVPLWKLLIAINAMIEEGCTFADITVEDEETISLRGSNVDPKNLIIPDVNQFEL